jgi:predicted Zn finger-like uncharacterized protein
MIIVCQKCSTRLQINDDKSPSRPFTVKCPKCNTTNNCGAGNSALEQSALGVGGSPSTDRPRFDQSTAPAYELASKTSTKDASGPDDAVRMLVDLLSKNNGGAKKNSTKRPSWDRRKALVCASEAYRESIARKLSENNYEVYLAADTRQAIETMRANQLEAVLLEPQFDSAEQGAAFVVREINVLRPAHRRRLFFVLLSPSLRTMDAHAAFLNNSNAVVNLVDVDELPRILEVAFREYNELYREFNTAFELTPL